MDESLYTQDGQPITALSEIYVLLASTRDKSLLMGCYGTTRIGLTSVREAAGDAYFRIVKFLSLLRRAGIWPGKKEGVCLL